MWNPGETDRCEKRLNISSNGERVLTVYRFYQYILRASVVLMWPNMKTSLTPWSRTALVFSAPGFFGWAEVRAYVQADDVTAQLQLPLLDHMDGARLLLLHLDKSDQFNKQRPPKESSSDNGWLMEDTWTRTKRCIWVLKVYWQISSNNLTGTVNWD